MKERNADVTWRRQTGFRPRLRHQTRVTVSDAWSVRSDEPCTVDKWSGSPARRGGPGRTRPPRTSRRRGRSPASPGPTTAGTGARAGRARALGSGRSICRPPCHSATAPPEALRPHVGRAPPGRCNVRMPPRTSPEAGHREHGTRVRSAKACRVRPCRAVWRGSPVVPGTGCPGRGDVNPPRALAQPETLERKAVMRRMKRVQFMLLTAK